MPGRPEPGGKAERPGTAQRLDGDPQGPDPGNAGEGRPPRRRLVLPGRRWSRCRGNGRYPTRPRSAAAHGATQVTVSGNNAGKTMSLLSHASSDGVRCTTLAGRVPQSPMEGLTPASADDLPPLGELLVDDPFWQYPAWGLARKGSGTCVSGPLRLLLRVTWLLSLRLAASSPSLNLPGGSGPAWLADTGPPSCCSSTTPRLSPAREWRPWTWSASALTGARTGPAYGRPRRRTRVTPGWNCGWPLTGTRSSAGPRAGSIGVTTITADCSWRPRDVVRLEAPEAARVPRPGWRKRALAWPLADRPRPGAPSNRHRRRRRARRLCRRHRRGDGQPGRDGLIRPSPAGYIWPWRTGPAGS